MQEPDLNGQMFTVDAGCMYCHLALQLSTSFENYKQATLLSEKLELGVMKRFTSVPLPLKGSCEVTRHPITQNDVWLVTGGGRV